ncbi:MAG: sensor histidine kinase [Solirubrobacterales bacterium]|nr:sensor histidine kinase [Solirubrobacterales bacterium]
MTTSDVLRLPLTLQPWKDLGMVVLAMLSAIVGFTLLFAGPVAGLAMSITIIGIPYLLASLAACRFWGNLERRRTGLRTVPWTWVGDTWWDKLKAALAMSWRDLAWMLLLFPVALAAVCAGVTAWLTGLGVLVAPAWMWAANVDFGLFTVDRFWETWPLAILLGPPLVVAGAWVLRGCVVGERTLATAVLGPGARERIQELTASRAGAVDAAALELRRIERDLHDGAQARLVALAMDLGMARERLASDPDTAATLIEGAHEDAKTALQELRDLARGIHPAILTDRGLDAAVSSLAARCPVPCTVDVRLGRRLGAATESAAYFVVAEALTNIAKHSGARKAAVSVRDEGDRVVVSVRDDGHGGADAGRGTGLAGLRGRVEAIDGRLVVDSPDGFGTLLRAELPA